ncbi:MAG TPA: NINE protein [Gemmata sp.]|jgi:TM2 domain-containing membrane protein YozV|nr:NINE protein [Gemmata sp.]
MSLIHLTCPACARRLEIDEESLGTEVECGSCCEVFVAKKSEKRAFESSSVKKESKADKEDSTRRKVRKRKRYEDDDDYDFDRDEYDDEDYDPRPARRSRRYRGEQKSRLAYILLGLFLGNLGIHNFYAGRIGPGIAQLIITLFSIPLMFFCIGFFTILIPSIWVLIEIIVVDEDANHVPMAT